MATILGFRYDLYHGNIFNIHPMTVALVKQAIKAFLQTSTPQVLCICGKWGVGKTFIWNDVLKQAIAEGAVVLPYYSYVSLFGLQNVDEVRQAIFENCVPTKDSVVSPNLESLGENIKRYGLAASRKLSKLVPYAKLPYLDKYVANFAGGFRHIVALSVHETIICFDDFERKKISAQDLLGIVSQFREQKDCKAVIILNEDALLEEEKSEFQRYFEKVVDIPIEFVPTVEECTEIAITETDFVNARIKENVFKLGISNIRIIRRIKTIAQDLIGIIGTFSEETKAQAIHTLTLLVWSKYGDNPVPISIIKNPNGLMRRLMGDDNRSEDERRWDKQLDEYGFNNCDEFDLTIISGVERGFFDEYKIVEQANLQHARQQEKSAQDALHRAWRTFHDTFNDSCLHFALDGIYAAYEANMKYVSRGNLDETIVLLRKLGFDEEASRLIAAYVTIHRDKITTVDEQANPFHSTIKDSDFREALAFAAVVPPKKPIKEILADLYRGTINQKEMDIICGLSTDELYNLFKSLEGDELYPIVEGSLYFRRVVNATAAQNALTEHALQALKKIGSESDANAIRVIKFGVDVTKTTGPSDEVAPNQDL